MKKNEVGHYNIEVDRLVISLHVHFRNIFHPVDIEWHGQFRRCRIFNRVGPQKVFLPVLCTGWFRYGFSFACSGMLPTRGKLSGSCRRCPSLWWFFTHLSSVPCEAQMDAIISSRSTEHGLMWRLLSLFLRRGVFPDIFVQQLDSKEFWIAMCTRTQPRKCMIEMN